MSKTVNAKSAAIGATLTYTITMSNTGSGDATDAEVQELPPSGLTLTAANTNGSGTFDLGTLLWTIPLVSPGTTATLTLVGTVGPGADRNADQPDQRHRSARRRAHRHHRSLYRQSGSGLRLDIDHDGCGRRNPGLHGHRPVRARLERRPVRGSRHACRRAVTPTDTKRPRHVDQRAASPVGAPVRLSSGRHERLPSTVERTLQPVHLFRSPRATTSTALAFRPQ